MELASCLEAACHAPGGTDGFSWATGWQGNAVVRLGEGTIVSREPKVPRRVAARRLALRRFTPLSLRCASLRSTPLRVGVRCLWVRGWAQGPRVPRAPRPMDAEP